MNTTEHLVELYYRLNGCLTVTDIKVFEGNNRQLDILAYNIKEQQFYHIEVSVAHEPKWAQTLETLKDNIASKFFGVPNKKRADIKNSDHNRKKDYYDKIKRTYWRYGFDPDKVIRVWCLWCLHKDNNEESVSKWKAELADFHTLKASNFSVLSFRDTVLPFLQENIGSSNYDDELLRTLSLLNQYKHQKKSDVNR